MAGFLFGAFHDARFKARNHVEELLKNIVLSSFPCVNILLAGSCMRNKSILVFKYDIWGFFEHCCTQQPVRKQTLDRTQGMDGSSKVPAMMNKWICDTSSIG
jgi:hypothetical protein